MEPINETIGVGANLVSQYLIPWGINLAMALVVFVVGMAIKARRRPVVSGMEELLGKEALVIEDFEQEVRVNIHSENWSAHCDTPLQKGQQVRVIGIDGLTLHVEPLSILKQELEQ